MKSETKYKGEPLSVSATISPAIGFSGNPEVAGYTTACSFFNSSFTTKELRVAITGNEFVARYGTTRDNSLSFGLDERPLLVEIPSIAESCRTVTGMPLTLQDSFGWGKNKSDISTTITAFAYSNVPDYGVKNFFASGTAASCAPEMEIGVEISSEQSGPPAGAGLSYVFTGPSITFSMGEVANNFGTLEAQLRQVFDDYVSQPRILGPTTVTVNQNNSFRVDNAPIQIEDGLYGTAAEFRFTPTAAQWLFGDDTTMAGLNVNKLFRTTGTFDGNFARVTYQVDYRYPDTDWVIDAATYGKETYRVRIEVR